MKKNKEVVAKKSNTKTANKSSSETTLVKLENFLLKNETIIFFSILLVSLIFSVLLFDIKMSEGNDDSDYIEGAFKLTKDFSSYYSTKAPLYPIFLSLPVSIWGINLPILKSLSILFSLLNLTAMYYAFRKLIPYSILFAVLIFTGINSYFLYFASQTYSEAFFCFLQALLFITIRPILIASKEDNIPIAKYLVFGITLTLLSLTKNITVGAIAAVALYFVFNRDFKKLAYAFGSFVVVRGIFEVIKSFIWGSQNQFSNQYQILIQKDPYNASKGVDDFGGFVDRLFSNTSIYIGKRLYQILGFVSPENTKTNSGLVLITFVFVGIGLYFIFKNKARIMQFTFLYVLLMAGLTFFVLQTSWDQPRMVLVYVPFIMMIIFYGLYYAFQNTPALRSFVFLIVSIIIIMSSLIKTADKSVANLPILKKNMGGDIYYGYTEDWTNFLKLSRYCGDSLPETAYVVSRKAPMSFIYSKGKSFYPIYTVPSTDPDSVLALLKENKVTHVLIASLRRNPKKNDGYVINTLHRMMGPVGQKYPDKLKLVKQVGTSEPSYLYEIKY